MCEKTGGLIIPEEAAASGLGHGDPGMVAVYTM